MKCGRPLLARDRAFERECVREIAGTLGVDVEPLIEMAQRRADRAQVEYGRDFPDLGRDLAHEALEELADAPNYVVWLLDAIRRDLEDGWDVEQLQLGLKHIVLGFEAIRAAQSSRRRSE